MAARYKSAFASASGFCSANAAQRIGASPAASSKKRGPIEVSGSAPAAVAPIRMPARAAAKHAKRAA